jgi:hypothetical protein
VDYPDFLGYLHCIDQAEGIAPKRHPKPSIGFAMSAFPFSAAIVRAARHMDLAPSGNVSKSLRADLIHEIFRVSRVIVLEMANGDYVVIYDNICQEVLQSQIALS